MIDTPTLLHKARKDAGLTQAELARKAGTSQPAVARYESGVAAPSTATLERLLQACGYTAVLDLRRAVASDLDNPSAKLLKAHRKEITEILAKRGFHSPRVFGSTARGDSSSGSDIDLLVTTSRRLDLMNLLGAQGELEELLGVSVDLATEEILRPELEATVAKEAVPV